MQKNIEIKISNENIDYFDALFFMENRVNQIRKKEKNELIWFLNHDHIYTCGASANKNEILTNSKIPVIQTNRGGRTTYHGPGQRIVYFLIDLNNRKKDVRNFVKLIEKSTICFLQELNIIATTYPERVGIWVTKSKNILQPKEKKIGAIGLRIRKWITYHGLSFNINPNLKYYNDIHACGLKDYSATSLQDLNSHISVKQFDKVFLKYFLKELNNF